MDIKQLIGDSSQFDAMPTGLRDFLAELLAGEIKQFVLVCERQSGTVASIIDILDDDSNPFTMLGIIESTKRDFMRMEIESRVEYKELEDDDV